MGEVKLDRPYCSLEELKDYVGRKQNDSEYEPSLIRSINRASRLIDEYTQQFYYSKTLSAEAIEISKAQWSMFLPTYTSGGLLYSPRAVPIIEITEIIENGITLEEGADKDYVVYTELGRIEKVNGSWDRTLGNIVISGSIGYASIDTETPSENIPGDIILHCRDIAARLSGRYVKQQITATGKEDIELKDISKGTIDALKKKRPIYLT